ncbi:MAG: hypothetical protein K6B68_14810 [Eubacterium sp.]|nr:hypothetical protein [Eubacterium sp.]
MKNLIMGMIIAFIIMYWISPIDAMPGLPIDDVIVSLLGLAATRKIGRNEIVDVDDYER